MTDILISGAGVAGPTLAYWLARNGFRPTVVERSQGLRSSGNPVDVRGPAFPVAEQMGILPALREHQTRAKAMRVLGIDGKPLARVPMGAQRAGSQEVELPRGELASVLYAAARDHAEFLFDETITGLHQDEGGVDVTFDRAGPRRFDLVIGADGLHSTTRRLVFGPEADFVRHMGVYVATLPLGEPAREPDEILMYNTPGRLLSIHPANGDALAAFIFRGPAIPGFDHRDMDQHKKIVLDAYAGIGWRVPELLDRVRTATDLYFDSVSQVRLPAWSTGRVALVGDAAACLSLFGEGSSLAMSAGYTLAATLAEAPHDVAFARYETEHRKLVEPKQRNVSRAAGLIVPKTRLGIGVRNLAARVGGTL
ncbi:FAD-dependent monooxygenase [Hamadaea tsunoensis]|uniref:FAD-dependent monooxygenase n=1 Tax=Hamadaea tsunoensis TaxID=53368 RepID=UPI00040BEFD6|nr:FAD-dependent monooxygenase [Hamadaea tsunoensis]